MENLTEAISTMHNYIDKRDWNLYIKNLTIWLYNNTETYEDSFGNKISFWSYFNMTKTLEYRILVNIILTIVILATVVGNLFIISAIKLDRDLRKKSNILIASLAMTDLLVGVFVMPIYMLRRILGYHMLPLIGNIFVSILSTFFLFTSFYHLFAIALDRYWAVTNFTYMVDRSLRRIIAMIVLSWSAGLTTAVLYILPFFLFFSKTVEYKTMKLMYCYFDVITLLFLSAVTITYIKIYRVAKKNIHARLARRHNCAQDEEIERRERQKENKALRTVAIITGTCIACWCPLIVENFIETVGIIPYYGIHELFTDMFWWMTYCNSTINPVIYTVFNPDFRAAFMRLLYDKIIQHGTRH